MSKKQNVLIDSDKLIGETHGALSTLFRKILIDLNIGPMVWNRLMQRYMDRKTQGRTDTKELHRLRNTMDQALSDKDMTIKTFFQCLDFVSPEKAQLRIKVEFPMDHPLMRLQGVTLIHTEEIPFRQAGISKAFLKRIFDTLCTLAKITADELDSLKMLALDDPKHGFSQDPSLKASNKSNLTSYLSASQVTWKIFRRLLFLLKPKRVYLSILLTMPFSKETTVHEVVFKPRFSK